MTEKTMDETEARRILEHLARCGPPTAQVAAIKCLRQMDAGAKAAEEAEKEANGIPPGWEDLYDNEFSRRRRRYPKGAA